MLARYAPTYSFEDLLGVLRNSSENSATQQLCLRLQTLYGARHVFLLESAREALRLLLLAYNRPGGVLMPAYTCIVVPQAVYRAGYYPVFVDIDERSLNVTVDTLRKALCEHITVALVTHLFGIPGSVLDFKCVLEKRNVLFVEDAAPALGAELKGEILGSQGEAAIISFHSAKVISGEGGGALLTNNDLLASNITRLLKAAVVRTDKWRIFVKALFRKAISNPSVYPIAHFGYRMLRHEYMYEVADPGSRRPPGFFRLCPEGSVRLVLKQMDGLGSNLRQRRSIARIYGENLSNQPALSLVMPPEGSNPSWIQFPVRAENKLGFYMHMQSHGIDVSWSYRYSCPDSYGLNGFVNAHEAARTVLGLPTYPSLSETQALYISRVAKQYHSN